MPTALIAKFLAELGATVLREGRAADEPFARVYAADVVWRAQQERVERCASVDPAEDVLLARADICLLGGEDLPGLQRSTGAGKLCEQFPRLIALEVTGYPQGSSHEGRPAVDILVQSVSGLAGEQCADRPIFVGFKPSLYGAALQGIAGVLAALIEREASGRGQAVFTSLFQGALCWCAGLWCDVERATRATSLVVPKDVQPLIFRCNDGQYLHLALYTPGSLEAAYGALGIETQGATGKKENAVPPSAPSKFFGDVELIAPYVARRSSGELLESLRAAGVACDLVLPPGACWDHPQTEQNRVIARDNDNRAYVGNPIQLGAGRGAGNIRALASAAAPLGRARIVDLGTFVAGPFGSVILGDLGADVIKVESMTGDTARTVFRCDASVNRGKRNIKLDLKSPRGIEVLKRLCGRANLVMSNFRAGVSARLGIDPVSLQGEFPGLAVIECPAYGNAGPRCAEAGFDMVMQAWCGHEFRAGGIGNPPLWSRLTLVDYGGGMLGAAAALACLYQQARTGGQITATIPLLHAGLYLLSELVRNADGTFEGAPTLNSEQTGIHPAESFYQARDGWLAIAARDAASARRLVAALEIQDDVSGCAAQWGSREQVVIAAALRSMPRARALDLLERYEVWAEPWNEGQPQKWLRDPALNESGSIYRTEYPDIGAVGMIGTLVHFSRSVARGRGCAPAAGEHTRQILAELGYNEAAIAELYADNVVA
jgi:crotonobetainyl-CoA:carnitine CoA-transferase CaiB-like acyl-CoA transferase